MNAVRREPLSEKGTPGGRRKRVKDGREILTAPLGPDRLGDFLGFFETGIPSDEWGHRCYCAAFCGKDNCAEEGMEKPEIRREAAIRYIEEGTLRGYLAYADGAVVGWCGANDRNASRRCFGVKWIIGAELPQTAEKAVSVFCFEVAPAWRGKHVATALLCRVIEDARAEGCSFVEAYPLREGEDALENYSGYRAFYEKNGFLPAGGTDRRLILRRPLRTDLIRD